MNPPSLTDKFRFPLFRRKVKLSIIVNFHNMRREAERTLYSLTPEYQKGVSEKDYEVVVIDNNSTQPLDPEKVKKFGCNFHYLYFKSETPSPCKAINEAAAAARGKFIMCCIDGARILSPGILKKTLDMISIYKEPFIYTIGMHLGDKLQTISVSEGYNQLVEDELINNIDWKKDGYSLFSISCLAGSAKDGYFSQLNETNCFTISKKRYLQLGGYNEAFTSPGGGLCNLDIFNRLNTCTGLTSIMLLGEASFHQFHGGIITNTPRTESPWKKMAEEYARIYHKKYELEYVKPIYYGEITEESKKFHRFEIDS